MMTLKSPITQMNKKTRRSKSKSKSSSKKSISKPTKKVTRNKKKSSKSTSVPKEKSRKSTQSISLKKGKVKTTLVGDKVICENTNLARELYNQSRFGIKTEDKIIELSLHDAVYLLDKKKITVKSARKSVTKEDLFKKGVKLEPNFFVRHAVYHDFRSRGYIIKTALKFGADFRVYDRGIKPGEDHAKWVVFPVKESSTLTWHEFSAKNRVAHSTKKRLLIGCVDEEGAVTYWEVRWIRP